MGVDADGIGEAESKIQHYWHHSVYIGKGGYAMDNIIWPVIMPTAIIDGSVGMVWPWYECKGGYRQTIAFNKIAMTVANVGL